MALPLALAQVHVLGSINFDIVTEVMVLPVAGETVIATGGHEGRGGKGANQAVAAARYGVATRMFGADSNAGLGACPRMRAHRLKLAHTKSRESAAHTSRPT